MRGKTRSFISCSHPHSPPFPAGSISELPGSRRPICGSASTISMTRPEPARTGDSWTKVGQPTIVFFILLLQQLTGDFFDEWVRTQIGDFTRWCFLFYHLFDSNGRLLEHENPPTCQKLWLIFHSVSRCFTPTECFLLSPVLLVLPISNTAPPPLPVLSLFLAHLSPRFHSAVPPSPKSLLRETGKQQRSEGMNLGAH